MNLGNKIKKICEERHLTLRKLALKMGIAEQTLYRNIKRGSMETKYLERMATILNVSISYFLDDNSLPITILHEPEIKHLREPTQKDYVSLLEEIRELSRENRELCKQIIELEEEIKSLKLKSPCPDQKSKVFEMRVHRYPHADVILLRIFCLISNKGV